MLIFGAAMVVGFLIFGLAMASAWAVRRRACPKVDSIPVERAVPPTLCLELFTPGQQLRGASGRIAEMTAEPRAQAKATVEADAADGIVCV
jgi:hypothetical protein